MPSLYVGRVGNKLHRACQEFEAVLLSLRYIDMPAVAAAQSEDKATKGARESLAGSHFSAESVNTGAALHVNGLWWWLRSGGQRENCSDNDQQFVIHIHGYFAGTSISSFTFALSTAAAEKGNVNVEPAYQACH